MNITELEPPEVGSMAVHLEMEGDGQSKYILPGNHLQLVQQVRAVFLEIPS